ncbi:MAG: acyl carrier protein [Candidatus Omnitrophica bacterium]|nr:acyl carrier protein [Candidatus Omnitrophota bacterium]
MKKLKQILSKVLEIDEEAINDDTSPDNVEAWDSFNGLMLISELESGFNINFTMDEVTSTKCVKDIIEVLKKHGVNLYESS